MLRNAVRPFAFVLLVTSLVATAATAGAQIRGRSVETTDTRWLLSLGASAAILSDVNDGATQSTWKFGNDPLMLYRGAIEKSLDEATTIGVAVAYGKVGFTLAPFVPAGNPRPGLEALPVECVNGCEAETDLYQAMAQFRSGGGPGFHTFFEANGGVTSFRNMRSETEQSGIGDGKGKLDLSGTLGAGFGYTLSQKLAITLVQDFGIGYHSKDDLPSGTSRSWRIRNTRAALRFSF